ncbi:uncharacterized protein epn1b [Diretmus argenteus]
MTSSMLRRQLKNLVQNYSEAEVKVREATSNDPWGPSSSQMADISDLTYNVVACNEIMTMLWKRLKDDKNWRHIHKSLTLLEYLLKTGDDRVLLKMKDNIYIVKALTEFRFVEKDGKDQGLNVREKAKVVLVLMEDDEKLKEERDFAVKTREKTSKNAAASSSDAVKDPNYKPCYVVGATGLPSLDNIPSVADLAASFAARKEERLRQEAEKRDAERRSKMTEEELQWEDAGKGEKPKSAIWGGVPAEEEEEEEEEKPDAWGAPKEPNEATDPWGAPTKPTTTTTTDSDDPWGAPTKTKTDEDPFAAQKTEEDPFAAPKNGGDPFAAPRDKPDPFSAAKDGEDPFAPKNNSDPFNTPKDDPFSAPKDSSDPFAAPNGKEDPFTAPNNKPDPFNTPNDDPFNTPKDDPFNSPKDDPFNSPKDDPFNAPKDDPFTAPASTPPKEDPFAAPTTPPKEDPFSTPSNPAKDDPFAAPTTPPKEDPFAAPSSPPKDDPSDPFNAPAVSPPKGDMDAWGAPASSPPSTGSDPWGAPTTPQMETKGGDIWGDGITATVPTGASDPFGDTSKPDDDPWGAPAAAPASAGDAWGSPAPPSDSAASDDPFGDGASKTNAASIDLWGAPSNAPSNGTGKQTAREEEASRKAAAAAFLGSAGASLVDLDSLLCFSPKPKQPPLANNTLAPQTQASGVLKGTAMSFGPIVRTMPVAGMSLPATSSLPSGLFGPMPVSSPGVPSLSFGAPYSSKGTPLFQLPSNSIGNSHSDLNMPAVGTRMSFF